MRGFADGRHRLLVAIEAVARGVDVEDVAQVVNYDMPKEAEDFVHRVGRTGRAATYGGASTFAAPDEAHTLKKTEPTLAIHTRKYRVRPNSAFVVSECLTGDGASDRMERSPRLWHR